jgi:hypothetical protein
VLTCQERIGSLLKIKPTYLFFIALILQKTHENQFSAEISGGMPPDISAENLKKIFTPSPYC